MYTKFLMFANSFKLANIINLFIFDVFFVCYCTEYLQYLDLYVTLKFKCVRLLFLYLYLQNLENSKSI